MEFWKRNNMFAKTFEKEVSNLVKVVLENQPSKRNLMCLVLKYDHFLMQNILLIKMLCNKNNFYKTSTFWLLKINYLFNLWEVHCWNVLQPIYIQKLCFFWKQKIHERFYFIWWRKQNKSMFCQNWKNDLLQ